MAISKNRRALTAALAVGTLGFPFLARATGGGYPNKMIRIVVPFGAGSLTDTTLRLISPKLAETLNTTIVIENKAGASGMIGSSQVVGSPPDGYTLLMAAVTSHGSGPALFQNLPYDIDKDFTAVGLVGAPPAFFAVHPSVPADDLKSFVEWAKAQPEPVPFSSVANGSSGHLTAEHFALETGCRFLQVPYKEAGQAVTDLIAGHVKFMIYYAPLIPHINSGALKALAVLSDKRADFASNIPTATEQGFPGVESYGWTGLFGPGNLDPKIVEILNTALITTLQDEEIAKKMAEQGQQIKLMSPADFESFLKDDRAKWASVAKHANITL